MRKLIITTAAINRPDLHKKSFSNYFQKLREVENYKIIWLINIDPIKTLSATQKETRDNIIKIIKCKKIESKFFMPKNPNFCLAMKRLFKNAKEMADNSTVFFNLEDDWEFTNMSDLNTLLDNINGLGYMNIAAGGFGALQPSLIGYNMFMNTYAKIIEDPTILDPEVLSSRAFREFINNKTINYIYLQTKFENSKNNKFNDMISKHKGIYYRGIKSKRFFLYCIDDKANICAPREIKKVNSLGFKGLTKRIYIIVPIPRYMRDIGRDWIKDKTLKKWNKRERDGPVTYSFE